MKPNEMKSFVLDNLMWFITGATILVYIAISMLRIGTSGRSIGDIFAEAGMFLLLALVMRNLFALQGISKGSKSSAVTIASTEKRESYKKIKPIVHHLDEFCKKKNADNLREKRFVILSKVGGYLKYFDERDEAKQVSFDHRRSQRKKWWHPLQRRTEEQLQELERYRAFQKAKRVKIKRYTPDNIIGDESGDTNEPTTASTKRHLRGVNIAGGGLSIAIALAFGLFVAESAIDFSFGGLIWRIAQAVFATGMGFMQMHLSYGFMKGEYASQLIRQSATMEEFHNLYADKAHIPSSDIRQLVRDEILAIDTEELQEGT